MKAIDALKEALNSSGIPITHIGLKLGRRPNYVSGIATRGSTPQADTLASMLSVCGYVLAVASRQNKSGGSNPEPSPGRNHQAHET